MTRGSDSPSRLCSFFFGFILHFLLLETGFRDGKKEGAFKTILLAVLTCRWVLERNKRRGLNTGSSG